MKKNSLEILETTIFYYTHGKGRPLLFLHGHRSDALRWRGAILFLGKKFKVYAPDLPGFGQSPELKEPHTMENYGQYMNKFVEKLDLKDYALFGGSMGGIIGLKMLLQNPKIKPKKLVLFGTPYDKKYWKLSLLDETLLFIGKNSRIFLPLSEMIIKSDFLLSRLLYLVFPKEAKKKEVIEYEMKQWRVMPMRIWFETIVDILEVDFSKVKFQTKIPTIIINAERDQYFDNLKTTEGLKKLCPNSKVFFLPFAAHIPKGELKLKHLKDFQFILEEIVHL